jgi:hypothetical protein
VNQDKTTNNTPIHQGKMLKAAVDNSKQRVLDIAGAAGIPVSSLYDLFKKEDVPRLKLKKLCDALDLVLSDFYYPTRKVSEGYMGLDKQSDLDRLVAENELLRKRIEDLEKIISLIDPAKRVD